MRLRYSVVIGFLLPASVAWGDGCYFPERAVRKIPEIVVQRAVLSWKDGVETLVAIGCQNGGGFRQETNRKLPISSCKKFAAVLGAKARPRTQLLGPS
jgi:hypothetical protein